MLFLAILVLALGWAGWVWAWARDRASSSYGLAIPFGARPTSRWGMPQSPAMARTRRRDVLIVLAGVAIVTFVCARSWSLLWALHGLADIAFVAYAVAAFGVEQRARPKGPLLASPRLSLQPIVDDGF